MNRQAAVNGVDEIDFKAELLAKAAQVDEVLRELLASAVGVPQRLAEAMEYMALAGGKRIRGALVLWVCELIGGQANREGQTAAAAVEMIHTYSLIHDDLPAMDDDDMRRGRPSCHKQFDEATAILTGDALLTLAFEILSAEVADPKGAVRMIGMLAQAAGPAGMIAGQMADLEGEHTAGTVQQLQTIHMNKTGRMFAAACGLGAIAGGASQEQIESLLEYGLKIGLGFQIADDLLDASATSEQLGKTAGKDIQQGKMTYPSLVGAEEARHIAEALTAEAIGKLDSFGPQADVLRRLAQELLKRKK